MPRSRTRSKGVKNPIKQPNPFFKICSKNGQAAPIPILLLISVFIAIGLNATRISTQHFFIFFLCLFVFALAFFRTDFAIVLLIFSMLLSPELKVGQLAERAVVIRIDDIFIFVIFCGWLAKLAVFKELAIFQKTPLNGPILIYIFLCLVSTTLMLLGGTGSLKHSFFYLLKYFEYFIIYYLVVHNLKDMRQVKIFIFL